MVSLLTGPRRMFWEVGGHLGISVPLMLQTPYAQHDIYNFFLTLFLGWPHPRPAACWGLCPHACHCFYCSRTAVLCALSHSHGHHCDLLPHHLLNRTSSNLVTSLLQNDSVFPSLPKLGRLHRLAFKDYHDLTQTTSKPPMQVLDVQVLILQGK